MAPVASGVEPGWLLVVIELNPFSSWLIIFSEGHPSCYGDLTVEERILV